MNASLRVRLISQALILGILTSISAKAAVVLGDDFNYAANADIIAENQWDVAFGSNPAVIDLDGATDKALALNSRGIYRDLSSEVTTDWTITVSMLHNTNSRNGYVLFTGAPVANAVSGYGFLWRSGTNGEGTIELRKFSAYPTASFGTAPPAVTAWDDGDPVVHQPASGGAVVAGTPTVSSAFSTFTLSWTASTNTLSLLNADGILATSEIDNDFSSFSRIYMSGNSTTYFDSIVVETAAVPEPSSFAALAGLSGLALVALRRRRR